MNANGLHVFEDVDASSQLDQGDLFVNIVFPGTKVEVDAVLITPACDLEQNKTDFCLLISTMDALRAVSSIISGVVAVKSQEEVLKGNRPLSKKERENAVKWLQRNSTGAHVQRLYFLPGTQGKNDSTPARFLDFQKSFIYETSSLEKLRDKRILRVRSPWREQIATRFSAYVTRVGTEDYDGDLFENVLSAVGLRSDKSGAESG